MLMLVQVYGDSAMKKTAVYKWVKRFYEGRESVIDEERYQRRMYSGKLLMMGRGTARNIQFLDKNKFKKK